MVGTSQISEQELDLWTIKSAYKCMSSDGAASKCTTIISTTIRMYCDAYQAYKYPLRCI